MKKLIAIATFLIAAAAQAQTPANSIPCLKTGQPLEKMPLLAADDNTHILRGTIYTVSEQQRIASKVGTTGTFCYPQWVRAYRIQAPPPNPPSSELHEPMPGPVLRAQVGDLIELTFLNQIDPTKFPNADKGCDQTSTYPGTAPLADQPPDCFNGSVFTNIHYHGTHTSPNTTGDNVFLEIRPSPRAADATRAPLITAADVEKPFDEFFTKCRAELTPNNAPIQWPREWAWKEDLPLDYRTMQETYLTKYAPDWWKADLQEMAEGHWPQFYIGAYPYCFRLPVCQEPGCPPPESAALHMAHTHGAGSGETAAAVQPLIMGQSPGTHWYHAHKHGSTTINVMNGLTGVFIIEGPSYDGYINDHYGREWTRTQPVLLINQIGTIPSLEAGGKGGPGPDFSINGRMEPAITMRPGEVQMWRIANTSSRAGAYFIKPAAGGVQWRQIAQDGVQFADSNYQGNANRPFLLAAGNRADILIKAPPLNAGGSNSYPILVYNTVNGSKVNPFTPSSAAVTLLTVNVSGTAMTMDFLPKMPDLPKFLNDIPDVPIAHTIRFKTTAAGANGPSQQTIDDKKFDGEVGVSVVLNQTEAWKIVNETYAPSISHPFHIHINPFQITEVFDPNQQIQTSTGTLIPKYVYVTGQPLQSGQCYVNPKDPTTWHPCDSKPSLHHIWWDVFPIPAGITVSGVNIPGYFIMRSRFVDYHGWYVLHCHILAHEDRGMMTVVEVTPLQAPYAHH